MLWLFLAVLFIAAVVIIRVSREPWGSYTIKQGNAVAKATLLPPFRRLHFTDGSLNIGFKIVGFRRSDPSVTSYKAHTIFGFYTNAGEYVKICWRHNKEVNAIDLLAISSTEEKYWEQLLGTLEPMKGGLYIGKITFELQGHDMYIFATDDKRGDQILGLPVNVRSRVKPMYTRRVILPDYDSTEQSGSPEYFNVAIWEK